MKKFSQRIGEGVRIYKKTEEDEDFVQQERLVETTRDATDKLVKCLAPKAGPKNRAKKIVKSGEKMQEVDTRSSEFGRGVACLGQTMKELGHEHAELENHIAIQTINPLKAYRDGDLKEIANLKKRYESNRLEYDTAKRVYSSKNTPENEDKMNRTRMRYEEARDAYYEKLQHSQDDDHEHLELLQAYARNMVEYHRKCMEIFKAAEKEIEMLSAAARPAAQRKSSFSHKTESHVTGLSVSHTQMAPQRPPSMMAGQPQPYAQQQPQHFQAQPQPYVQQAQQPAQYGMAPPMPARTLQPGMAPAGAAPLPGMRPAGGPTAPMGTGHHQQQPMTSPRGDHPALPMRPRTNSAGPKPIERCRALYDFEPQGDVPNAMGLKSGDVITVLNKTPSGWWEGELRGQIGFFPSNYVQPM